MWERRTIFTNCKICDVCLCNLGSFKEYHTKARFGYVRLEVLVAVTMKNVIFWDINIQFVLHRRHIISLLQSPAG
jgi:hypothetical protein